MVEKFKVDCGKKILDVVITQEKIGKKVFFVAQGIQIDVASQGLSLREALDNIKDAANVVINSSKEAKEEIKETEKGMAPMLTRICL
ncbi:MAG: hypothetical protein JSW08_02255 [archaeon]|nr:MAG: hypothetical protein JSW08_02255 [archaeon]